MEVARLTNPICIYLREAVSRDAVAEMHEDDGYFRGLGSLWKVGEFVRLVRSDHMVTRLDMKRIETGQQDTFLSEQQHHKATAMR